MKKVLSLILVAIMLMTVMPVAVAEGNTYKVGDIIQFGLYPQSRVYDIDLIAKLSLLAPTYLEQWHSFNYYSGTGDFGTMQIEKMMVYSDIEYNGVKYRAVWILKNRPYYTFEDSSHTYQKNYGYNSGFVYWFKFEPIDWRVLDPTTGLVMCETIIDSQPYSNTIYFNSGVNAYFNDSSYEKYASDYESSSIRKWLNNNFYSTAFTDSEKRKISTTTLNNDGYYTSVGITGYGKFDSSPTEDKVFMLSYNEVNNSEFGFNFTKREGYGSDYAKSQGLKVSDSSNTFGESYWLLRTPYTSGTCCVVGYNGDIRNKYYEVSGSYVGIRPALCFVNITQIHQHKHTLAVTKPTCITQGFTTYTCECGDTYVDNYVKENGHNHTSEITTPATHLDEGVETFICNCGDTYTKPVPKLEKHTYTSSVTTEPTHLKEGVRTFVCECKDTYTESIPKLTEHTHIPTVTLPTCEAKGYTTYTCECGDSYVADYVKENGHSFTNYISDGKATCVTDGSLIAKCDNCDKTDTKPEKGGHNFSTDFTIDLDPTCTSEGQKSRHCLNCTEKTDVTVIGKLAHTYSEDITTPTCTAQGYTTYTCSCGDTYKDNYVDKLEHGYNVTTIAPNCTDKGYNVYTCSCSDSYTETIEATGHSFSGSACVNCGFDKAATCSCNCHKSGISGFIWKILSFFYKLFRTNGTCSCGAAHY